MGRHGLLTESEISAHIARVLAVENEEDREAAIADVLLEAPEAGKGAPETMANVALAVASLILHEDVGDLKLAFSLDALLGTGSTGQAGASQAAEELLFKSIYAQAAFRRVARAGDQQSAFRREVQFHRSHLLNSRRRISAARLVDAASKEYGPVLGWRAVMDDSTTSECRYAHGKNFRVDMRPAIGWPGSVHGWCRCGPAPAVPGAVELK